MHSPSPFLKAILRTPLESAPSLVYADYRDEQGRTLSAEAARLAALIRSAVQGDGPRPPGPCPPDLLAALRGRELTEAQWSQAGGLPDPSGSGKQVSLIEAFRTLAASDPRTMDVRIQLDIERRILTLLGQPGPETPVLHTPEGVKQQYDFQLALLASLNLLESRQGVTGIVAADGAFHPAPQASEVATSLQTPAAQQKLAEGFDTLLLVPFALPLRRLLRAWHIHLVRNHPLTEAQPEDRESPGVMLEVVFGTENALGPDEDGRMVYFPERFDNERHNGHAKQQLLGRDPRMAWQMLLVEGAAVTPPMNRGPRIGGRTHLLGGRNGPGAGRPSPEAGTPWTPESYVSAFLTSVERTGRTPDRDTSTYLAGSFLPGCGRVPCMEWEAGGPLALLVTDSPEDARVHIDPR